MKLSLTLAASLWFVSAAFAQQQPYRSVTPEGFQLPPGGNCSAEIARYRAIQENDEAMGNVAQRVYDQIKSEIAVAERECSAGHDAQSRAMILTSKRKHGYPTGL
jgi:hypothetical protein